MSKAFMTRLSHYLLALIIVPAIVICVRNSFAHEEQLQCLTQNAYYEARGEPVEAQKFLVYLTLARTADQKGWGKTPCETVYQPKQFSWTNGLPPKPNPKEWERTRQIVEAVYKDPLANVPPKLKCARFYKRTDNKGVSERSKKFFATLKPVGPAGNHMAYCK